MRLVLCDDHELLLDALAVALTDLGYDVVSCAQCPDVAVDAVATHHPDVCLLDVNFPQGSSLPAISRMRSASPDTKVVVFSADSRQSLVAEALAEGASGYLRKEQPIDELVEALDLVAQGHLAIEPRMLQGALRVGQSSDDPLWPLSFLTDREWQVLRCVVDGLSTSDIARTLGVRGSTARTHVQNVLAKLGVHSRLQAAALIASHADEVVWPAHVRRRA